MMAEDSWQLPGQMSLVFEDEAAYGRTAIEHQGICAAT